MTLETTNQKIINWNDENASTGIKNSHLYDPSNNFNFNYAPCEEGSHLEGTDNTYIVLGRDRPGGWNSGYGAQGHLKCGAIDIVAGRVSSLDARNVNGLINSNFGADAARIYLSQKTNVDENFSIPAGTTGISEAQSAIAIKADAVRVIARESLKLVTNTDSKLSNGTDAYLGQGVQLISKSEEEIALQPIPKGDNLIAAFDELISRIVELNGIVNNFLNTQRKFNKKLSDHTHFSFFAEETTIDPYTLIQHQETIIDQFLNVETALKVNVFNIANVWKNKYIVPMSTPEGKYINSLYHSLN